MRLCNMLTIIGVLIALGAVDYVKSQVNPLATCGALGLATFFVSDNILCDDERGDQKKALIDALCLNRPYLMTAICNRCKMHGTNRERCNQDLGPMGVDDDPVSSAYPDDCRFDEDFNFCLDEHAN